MWNPARQITFIMRPLISDSAIDEHQLVICSAQQFSKTFAPLYPKHEMFVYHGYIANIARMLATLIIMSLCCYFTQMLSLYVPDMTFHFFMTIPSIQPDFCIHMFPNRFVLLLSVKLT